MSAEANEVATEAAAKKAKTVVTEVTMQDGRVVPFPGKRELVKTYDINEAEGNVSVRLDFRNGQVRFFVPPVGLLLKFVGHGAIQKLGDELADPKLTDIDDKVEAIDELIEQLNKGEWSSRREGGDSMAGTSVLLKALVELTQKAEETLEEAKTRVKAFLKDKKQPEKMALRNSPKIKPIVERLEAEKLASGTKIDTDALLAELG